MNPEATRELYWNIRLPFGDEHTLRTFITLQAIIPIGIMVWGLYREFRRWRAVNDQPLEFDNLGVRIKRVFIYAFAQPRLYLRKFPFFIHITLFYGMVLLFIGTTIVAIQADFAEPVLGWYFFKGAFYLIFSLVLDCAGLVVITAVSMGLWRRYAEQPSFLGGQKNWIGLLWFIWILCVSGFLVEGVRIAALNPEWGRWSPVGQALGALFGMLPEQTLLAVHTAGWWGHLVLSEIFIAMAGFAPLNHFFLLLANVFFAPGELPNGRIAPIPNMEEAEQFGVASVEQFTSKQLLDGLACVECGRCELVCPAWATGKPLNPKFVVAAVRNTYQTLAARVAEATAANGHSSNGNGADQTATATIDIQELAAQGPKLIGEAMDIDAIWACTTCGACEQECPALIPQIDKIIDMRRNLVLMEGAMSEEVQRTLTAIENEGNPWGVSAGTRGDWTEKAEVKVLDEGEETPLLYWVGCAGTCDSRAQQTRDSMIEILNAAGVEYAVLGHAETCTGDPARRIGNEYLYQMMAEQNIETLKGHKIKKIVTQCPHCFNTLKNEYPDFGGDFEVVHHTELIDDLIGEGKLKFKSGAKEKITFHDPCYLGRMNNKYDEPRDVIDHLPGVERVEMERSAERSFCCGAGGGRMFMEETIGTQINTERSREAIATGADTIAVGCPFCMTMMSDGVKNNGAEASVKVKDIAELVAAALVKEEPATEKAETAASEE